MSLYVCACVCERERERGREGGKGLTITCSYPFSLCTMIPRGLFRPKMRVC